jgi:hypothetical protein
MYDAQVLGKSNRTVKFETVSLLFKFFCFNTTFKNSKEMFEKRMHRIVNKQKEIVFYKKNRSAINAYLTLTTAADHN